MTSTLDPTGHPGRPAELPDNAGRAAARHRDRALGPAHVHPRRDRRERRAPQDRRRPRLRHRPRSRGSSAASRSPSAACCCSAAGSATSTAGAGCSSAASRSSRSPPSLGGLAQTPGDARRRPRGPGRRRGDGRARRPRPAHHQRSRRAGPAARARAVRRGLLRRHVARAAARRRRDRPRLVALDAVHQRADRAGDPGPDPALRRRDPAPPGPVRRRRRVQRHRWCRRARLDADRRPRARLDLGPHGPRLRRRAPRCSRCSPSTERRVAHPLLRPALLRSRRRSAAWPRSAWSSAASCRCSSSPCSTSRARSSFGPMATGLAFLPLTLGIFGMSRVTPRIMAAVGPLPMVAIGAVGLSASFAWLSTALGRRRLPERRASARCCSTASRPA